MRWKRLLGRFALLIHVAGYSTKRIKITEKRTNNERDTNKDPLSHEKLILETWIRFSLKNTSNLAMEMIEKVDVGGTARKTFIFDQIVFKERFHGVTLLHDEQLKYNIVEAVHSSLSFLLSCRNLVHCESCPVVLEHSLIQDYPVQRYDTKRTGCFGYSKNDGVSNDPTLSS